MHRIAYHNAWDVLDPLFFRLLYQDGWVRFCHMHLQLAVLFPKGLPELHMQSSVRVLVPYLHQA